MRRISTTLIALATFAACGAANAENAPKRSPELQVLNRFVGTWDMKQTVTLAGEQPTTSDVLSMRRWSEGGSFVVFDEPGQEEIHLPLTYDPESKTYRGVMSRGAYRSLVTATWDEDTRTMHFFLKDTDAKTVYRGTHRFIREDYAEASGTITDLAGQEILKLAWKQTRRKDAAKPSSAPKRSRGMQVLERFVGNWKTVVTHRNTGVEITTSQRRSWSRGGAGGFIVEESTLPNGTQDHLVWTYDPVGKVYRLTLLSRTGAAIIEGRWNNTTRTMAWTSVDSAGNKGTGKHRFIDKDHAEWSLAMKSPNGTVVFDASAKQTRVK
jgi:hypothetical protein